MTRILGSKLSLILIILVTSVLVGGAFVALEVSAGGSWADGLTIGAVVAVLANGVGATAAYGSRV